ncbi:MAG: CoA transferase [Chloroflexota bacterium]|nr:CoA transferase [Chloroflexota bacterium]
MTAQAGRPEARGRPPLTDIRVLELGHIVAGPSGGLLLADLGADVIKVEEPRAGDQARGMPNHGSTFYALNRNKRSLVVNLKSPEGRAIFAALVRTADVVLDNYAPGVLERLGIGYAWGAELNPRVIYCSIKGSLPGPYGDRPLLDELAQMMGSMAYMTGPLGTPLRAGSSVVDIGAATYGVLATLAALVDRQQTGRGQHVRSGLFETAVFLTTQHVAQAAITGEAPVPMPSRGMGSRLGWGVYQLFATADDRQVFIAITSNAHWARFCTEFELVDFLDDPTLDTNAKRCANRPRVVPRIEALTRSLTSAELVGRLEKARVPYAPVNTPLDVLDDPHLNSAGALLEVGTAEGAAIKVPAIPVASDGFELDVRVDPPALGEHTRELLGELGYAADVVNDLIERGVVRADGPTLTAGSPGHEPAAAATPQGSPS